MVLRLLEIRAWRHTRDTLETHTSLSVPAFNKESEGRDRYGSSADRQPCHLGNMYTMKAPGATTRGSEEEHR